MSEYIVRETGYPGAVKQEVIGELVRCEDCRCLEVVNKEPVYAVCEKNNHTFYLWQEDTRKFFCAYGERKDDDE